MVALVSERPRSNIYYLPYHRICMWGVVFESLVDVRVVSFDNSRVKTH
jgi:hypothetical protein